MFIEASYTWPVAYIGGTWDSNVALFQLGAANTLQGIWNSSHSYVATDAVVGLDGNVYIAQANNITVTPFTDDGTHWVLAPSFDLTDYSATMPVGPINSPLFALTSLPGGGLTMGGAAGTIVMQATPAQTSLIGKASSQHAYLKLQDSQGNIYFPLGGTIPFQTP